MAIVGRHRCRSVIEMVHDTNNIIGIFNYCDRWCERCTFTDRCLQYKTRPYLLECADNEEPMKLTHELSESFALAGQLIARTAAEFGIRMPSAEELGKPDPKDDARQARV